MVNKKDDIGRSILANPFLLPRGKASWSWLSSVSESIRVGENLLYF